jgi:organic hydroperoxide reductase OsmC/OhrA
MHPYPHRYRATANAESAGRVTVSSPGLSSLETAPPPEFGGSGGLWSPETLLCAAVADCFILTFRAVARAARFEWQELECRVEGVLERVEGNSRFTRYTTIARLGVPPGADPARARRLLEQAEHGCLIANSLRGARALETEIVTAEIRSTARETAQID